jgi:hypothetical protein
MHPSVRASPDQVARLLADEFIEFGSSGRVFDKRQIIELLQQEQGRANRLINQSTNQPTVADFSARRLAPDVILLTYRVSREPNDKKLNLEIRTWRVASGFSSRHEIGKQLDDQRPLDVHGWPPERKDRCRPSATH